MSESERLQHPALKVGVDAVLARVRDAQRPIIGVTGGQGSGKSTFAELVAARLDGAVVLSTDRYQPDFSLFKDPRDRDRPEHADLLGLRCDVETLAAGFEATAPIWSFHEHRRVGTEGIGPARAIVVEGLHALCDELVSLLDFGVLVDAPASVRLERVLSREATGARGFGEAESRRHFLDVAEPVFGERLGVIRARADLVIDNI